MTMVKWNVRVITEKIPETITRLSVFNFLLQWIYSRVSRITMSIITKLRSVHVADMAVFDWVATGLSAVALAKLVGTKNIAGVFVLMMIGAILIHLALRIPTRLNAYLGLAKKEDVYAARAAAASVT